jgi:peptide/nickel transport system ATP-binding protein
MADQRTQQAIETLLQVQNLRKLFPVRSRGVLRRVVGQVRAVDDVSFSVRAGETLGLVGESGCGKTTVGRCVIRAIEPTEGSIRFRMDSGAAVDVLSLPKEEMRQARKHMQLIFQDPFSSLNPRMTVRDIVGEPLLVHEEARGKEVDDAVAVLLGKVGLRPEYRSRYPHSFSGGQRQRIGVARALALNPSFVVCDEAVSALDVSVQAQILNLLQDVQKEFDLTYLFISHDLGVVEHIADRVAVMYVGKLVEVAESHDLFFSPLHPYTEALLSAVPRPDPDHRSERVLLRGEVADPSAPPSGCYFHPRCSYAKDVCSQEAPPLSDIAADGSAEHLVACHFARELTLRGVKG